MIKLQSGSVKSETRGVTNIGQGPAVQGSIVDTLAANRGARLA
jgi:hypothetical protein